MTFGEVIQVRRAALGLSQERLAELVGVSRQAVSKWEVGDALPDTDRLLPLARVLEITVDELLSGELGRQAPASEPEEEPPVQHRAQEPGWFALHWYWLGLIPVAWGCYMLLNLLVGLVSIGMFIR